MENLISQINRTIELSDVDYTGQYRLYNLFLQFEMLATLNGELIGLWNPSMKDQYGWVVSKQSLHLEEPIMKNDMIEISTLADNGTHVVFPRNYFIHKEGKQIGYCASLWTLIDIKNRRIVSPKRIGVIPPVFTHDKHLDAPQTIDLDIELKYIQTNKVSYSDIDINQHMNNRKYIEWALDLIDINQYKDHYISDLSVQYQKEIKPLSNVDLYLGKHQQRYIIQGKIEDTVHFTIEILFRQV